MNFVRILHRTADSFARVPIQSSECVARPYLTDVTLEVREMVMGNLREETEVAIIGGGPG